MTCRKSSSSTSRRSAAILFRPTGGETPCRGGGVSANHRRSVALLQGQEAMGEHHQSQMAVCPMDGVMGFLLLPDVNTRVYARLPGTGGQSPHGRINLDDPRRRRLAQSRPSPSTGQHQIGFSAARWPPTQSGGAHPGGNSGEVVSKRRCSKGWMLWKNGWLRLSSHRKTIIPASAGRPGSIGA